MSKNITLNSLGEILCCKSTLNLLKSSFSFAKLNGLLCFAQNYLKLSTLTVYWISKSINLKIFLREKLGSPDTSLLETFNQARFFSSVSKSYFSGSKMKTLRIFKPLLLGYFDLVWFSIMQTPDCINGRKLAWTFPLISWSLFWESALSNESFDLLSVKILCLLFFAVLEVCFFIYISSVLESNTYEAISGLTSSISEFFDIVVWKNRWNCWLSSLLRYSWLAESNVDVLGFSVI
jgi:hypothetical protein